MLESIFTRVSILARFQLSPLNKYFSELVVLLRKEKYSKDTIQRYLKAVEAFGKWLIVENIPLSNVNEDLLSLYINSLERRKLKSSTRDVLPHNAVGLKHFLLLLGCWGEMEQKTGLRKIHSETVVGFLKGRNSPRAT
jgi:Phage integrase, N-terminal SAM-like domain